MRRCNSLSHLVSALVFLACGTIVAVEGETPTPNATAAIVVEAVGGIAGSRHITRVDSAAKRVTLDICSASDSLSQCAARGNRVTRDITQETVRALFAATQTAEFRALRADYGYSTQGADLFVYEFRLTVNGRTRSIRADALTQPKPLGRLLGSVSKALFPPD